MLVGWHGFPEERQSEADDIGNWCLQVLTALFSYITIFTLPWRIANTVHLLGRKRRNDEGLDFYGRPTKGIWCAVAPP